MDKPKMFLLLDILQQSSNKAFSRKDKERLFITKGLKEKYPKNDLLQNVEKGHIKRSIYMMMVLDGTKVIASFYTNVKKRKEFLRIPCQYSLYALLIDWTWMKHFQTLFCFFVGKYKRVHIQVEKIGNVASRIFSIFTHQIALLI